MRRKQTTPIDQAALTLDNYLHDVERLAAKAALTNLAAKARGTIDTDLITIKFDDTDNEPFTLTSKDFRELLDAQKDYYA